MAENENPNDPILSAQDLEYGYCCVDGECWGEMDAYDCSSYGGTLYESCEECESGGGGGAPCSDNLYWWVNGNPADWKALSWKSWMGTYNNVETVNDSVGGYNYGVNLTVPIVGAGSASYRYYEADNETSRCQTTYGKAIDGTYYLSLYLVGSGDPEDFPSSIVVQIGGSPPDTNNDYDETMSGGLLAGGQSTNLKISSITGNGGLMAAGSAGNFEIDTITGNGGLMAGGIANVSVITSRSVSGGLQAGGNAKVLLFSFAPYLDLDARKDVSVSSGRVTNWINQSENAFQLTRATESQRPFAPYVDAGGLYGIDFDGNVSLRTTANLSLSGSLNYFLVLNRITTPAADKLLAHYSPSSGAADQRIVFMFYRAGAGYLNSYNSVSNPRPTLDSASVGQPLVIAGGFNTNVRYVKALAKGSIAIASQSLSGSPIASPVASPLEVGELDRGARFTLARVVIANQALTDAQIEQTMMTLARDHGISITHQADMTGGATCGGIANVGVITSRAVSGGVVVSGIAGSDLIETIIKMSGGCSLGGSAEAIKVTAVTATGGCRVGSQADASVIINYHYSVSVTIPSGRLRQDRHKQLFRVRIPTTAIISDFIVLDSIGNQVASEFRHAETDFAILAIKGDLKADQDNVYELRYR